MRMAGINLLSALGVVLSLIGLIIPWFYITIYARERGESIYVIPVELAPFFIRAEVQGKTEIQFFNVNLGANLIGAACVAGAILGLIGGGTDRDRLSLAGGLVTVAATILFLPCLPRHDVHISVGFGGIVTAIGGVLMFISGIIEIRGSVKPLATFIRSLLNIYRGISFWYMLRFILRYIALIGSIYSGFELSRIVLLILNLGSVSFSLGGHNTWLYILEISLCTYSAIYWLIHVILYLIRRSIDNFWK